jgi:hypothetical protein
LFLFDRDAVEYDICGITGVFLCLFGGPLLSLGFCDIFIFSLGTLVSHEISQESLVLLGGNGKSYDYEHKGLADVGEDPNDIN